MEIIIATDAAYPQINGVCRTIKMTSSVLQKMGYLVSYIEPSMGNTFPCPFYKEIDIAYFLKKEIIEKALNKHNFSVHIATEGPIGIRVRNYCIKNNIKFTTSYHTCYPESFRRMFCLPESISYKYFRWFHKPAVNVMATTPNMKKTLEEHGFNNVKIWTRGVDTCNFKPYEKNSQKVCAYIGRVSKEKNIEAFLNCKGDYKKRVVGDGPYRKKLQAKYPEVEFTGYLHGDFLARAYSDASVFVFPSLVDTFGLVILEALACGTPVAAYPCSATLDIIGNNKKVGCLNDSLEEAINHCLTCNPKDCREFALNFSWEKATENFVENLIFN